MIVPQPQLRPHHYHRGSVSTCTARRLPDHPARSGWIRLPEAALHNTLHQAPDVILIGEIGSRETMEHAVAFMKPKPPVHGNAARQQRQSGMDRIINFFPEERRAQC